MNETYDSVNPEWLSFVSSDSLVVKKILRSGFCVVFILETGETISPVNEQKISCGDLRVIAQAWKELHSLIGDDPIENHRLINLIDSLSEIDPEIDYPFNLRVRHLAADKTGTFFFCLIDKGGKFPVYSFFRKINYQKIRKGSFPIHASGVIYRNNLFIFGGPSGIGKSTISGLSKHHGAQVLDEDQLLLKKLKAVFSADAWGYSLTGTLVPLTAVFQLNQSEEDHLTRLNKTQTSRFLITQIIDTVGKEIPRELLRVIMKTSSEIARVVPGYQLHFRNSPDFWHLLGEEFHLE